MTWQEAWKQIERESVPKFWENVRLMQESQKGKVCMRPCNGPGGAYQCDYPKCLKDAPQTCAS